jgi:hypothetical protein
MHSDWFALDEHWAEQCPLQSVLQEPEQLKLPAEQPPVQLLSHEVMSQLALALALH